MMANSLEGLVRKDPELEQGIGIGADVPVCLKERPRLSDEQTNGTDCLVVSQMLGRSCTAVLASDLPEYFGGISGVCIIDCEKRVLRASAFVMSIDQQA